ncbi:MULTISPECIES: SDR family oxidoreductase [unclassified Virgibacillus]|uniref:SDR family oxidoreductase n=1 Tax=unclassified Virgibacillus TaxID=2620237 RepID=UPI0024DEE95C|nr:SDR family oxidoreductase [Virgibacillus sp. LDC-1]
MQNTVFITGYPGFLASSLIRQLLNDHKEDIEKIYVLSLPHLEAVAKKEINHMLQASALPQDLITILKGDITEPDLAMDHQVKQQIEQSVTHVFHLAAIYDLAVPKTQAYQVNVNGTAHVTAWVKSLPKIKRYVYFSTAYVSGMREGKIFEHELDMGQSFRNHYEHTKFQAEKIVRQVMQHIPTTIIRPGIVKGHAKTGKTIKFDGLYFMLNLLDKLEKMPFIPFIGDGAPEGNFVPYDYVLEATSYLSWNDIGAGKTYHLTDPNPYSMREIQSMVSLFYLGKLPKGQLPVQLVKAPLLLSPIRKWLKAEPEAMDYFLIHSSYDCSQTLADLEGSGIQCPDLKNTLQPMIDYYRKYKHDYTKQLDIK